MPAEPQDVPVRLTHPQRQLRLISLDYSIEVQPALGLYFRTGWQTRAQGHVPASGEALRSRAKQGSGPASDVHIQRYVLILRSVKRDVLSHCGQH